MPNLRLVVLAMSLFAAVPLPVLAAEAEISVADYLALWDRIDGRAVKQDVEEAGRFDAAKHPDFARVMDEIKVTAEGYRARVNAERAAWQTQHSCLPETEVEISTEDLIPHLRSYTPEQQATTSLAQAFAALMAKTYPCP